MYVDNLLHTKKINIPQEELKYLQQISYFAENDLKRAEKSDVWQSTAYENTLLPEIRLAGTDKQKVTLLNEADLHIHTRKSDGDDIEKILAMAVKLRLNAIAITDHDEIKGAFEARRIVHKRKINIAVVPGIEVSSRDGHIGALFVNKIIPKGLSARQTVKLIHNAGGIAVAHHPYSPPILDFVFRKRLGCRDLIKMIPFDAIECTNAVPGYGTRYNIEAYDAIRKNRLTKISLTGSSDAHYAGFVGKGRTYYAGNCGVDSLYSALKSGYARGGESYWKFREKIYYRYLLAKGIIKDVIRMR
ncbi:MAG: PHP domain-containing protein [Victivallales bacterium]|nr:PHP domain-containing protein [Victivallales bacterium]MCF7888667.1 PHP domain-containing protein [Victivallales bacterium]